jgi:hypothetical protein
LARGIIGDEFDAQGIERTDELHERVNIAPDHTLARFHALDSRQRQPGCFGKPALIDAKKRT